MIISKDRAKEICSNWHGGQWSALYQFSSSKTWCIENTLRYVWEVEIDLQELFRVNTGVLTKKNKCELKALKNFFLYKAKENNVPIISVKHSQYGYNYPLLSPEGKEPEMIKVKGYSMPI